MSRPWPVSKDVYYGCIHNLFPMWLRERGGIVVYENHVLDSSSRGDKTFMPARYIAEEDNQLHDAPEEYRPNGGVPSMRQQRVDHIKLEDFESIDDALKCFTEDQHEPAQRV